MNTAKLISYTQPAPNSNIEGVENAQDLVAYMARVSNPDNQNNKKTSKKLLDYLAKNAHWSPFEMVHATMEIETTRDIARQILRHRSFTFQEFSQRYADPTKSFKNSEAFCVRETRMQDPNNRQSSIEIENDPAIQLNTKQQELITDFQRKQHGIIKQAEDVYKWAVENGIAKEQARAVLPEGLTRTRLYMAGSLRSWLHFVSLRSKNGTQKEHSIVAIECAKELEPVFENIMKYTV